jgi:hypothetical protein
MEYPWVLLSSYDAKIHYQNDWELPEGLTFLGYSNGNKDVRVFIFQGKILVFFKDALENTSHEAETKQ